MIKLVPNWAHHYDEFWNAIRKRNQWFIKLRYFAVVLLAIFTILGEYLLNFELSQIQLNVLIIVTSIILIYNLIIQYSGKFIGNEPGKFNCLHLSLIQMILDLAILMILVYFTGGNESPLYMFFIFHMIIGSMILPGRIVYFIASIVIVAFSSLIVLQHFQLISSYYITGLFTTLDKHLFASDILFMLVFASMMLISVFIANTISKKLYKREQQLRRSLMEIDKMEISKQRYIMSVVHEIKSPIAAVKSMLELIDKKFLGDVNDQISNKIKRSLIRSDEAISLINNILKISKLRLLNITTPENILIPDLISSLLKRNSEMIESKNIRIDFLDERKLDKPIVGDLVLIELAISNIISNGIKYTPQNGNLRLHLSEKNKSLTIIVEDDGVGIPFEELSFIFKDYYRASNITGGREEGTGLGLALVKEIIEKHQGSVSVNSPSSIGYSERPGTQFIIKIPYKMNMKTEPQVRKFGTTDTSEI